MSLTWFDLFKAFALGLIEGLTELVPVSASGHLLLAQRFLGLGQENFGTTFVLMIRLGALLALLSVYCVRLSRLAVGMFSDPAARRFVIGMLIALLPAALAGVLAHDLVRGALFNVWLVCFVLIVGGAVLLWVDQLDRAARHHEVARFPFATYLVIGLAQCLALVPGVSRSGATIVAAVLLGADRRAAAEFSLWLAMPTLAGTLGYDLYHSHAGLTADNPIVWGTGFAAAFAAAWLVAKTFVDYVACHGFRLFAWWRVVVGTLGLVALAVSR
ncbi:MAG TPA: undecaprenyl-diphosphate phosphatase [Xanthobacteraceae bacterium]